MAPGADVAEQMLLLGVNLTLGGLEGAQGRCRAWRWALVLAALLSRAPGASRVHSAAVPELHQKLVC